MQAQVLFDKHPRKIIQEQKVKWTKRRLENNDRNTQTGVMTNKQQLKHRSLDLLTRLVLVNKGADKGQILVIDVMGPNEGNYDDNQGTRQKNGGTKYILQHKSPSKRKTVWDRDGMPQIQKRPLRAFSTQNTLPDNVIYVKIKPIHKYSCKE